jgi:hypothetical protein
MTYTCCGCKVPGITLLHDLKGAMRLDCSRHVCACLNSHLVRFQRINTSCVDVVTLIRRMSDSKSHLKSDS